MAFYVLFSLKVFLEWNLFNLLLIHTLDTALSLMYFVSNVSGCAFFSVSHHPWARHLLRKKHQKNYNVNICWEIMCCMKLLLVNCIIRHESIFQWHVGDVKKKAYKIVWTEEKFYYFKVSFLLLLIAIIRSSIFKARIFLFLLWVEDKWNLDQQRKASLLSKRLIKVLLHFKCK